MAPSDTALKTTAGGSVPGHCEGEFEHPDSQPQPLKPSTEDMVLIGLRLGNLMALACYGVRGEYRG